MAVPKRKVSPSRRNSRRSHDALKQSSYITDKNTGSIRQSHRIDKSTGIYRNMQVLENSTEE